jgi:uncharacterized protein (UPF0333 family)
MNKKGQAAMEFLMTYGWAILAAVIVIAALAYFGVFSPSKYMPSTCTLTAPFGCDEYAISAASGVSLVIRNGGGDSMTVSNIAVTGCTDYTTSTIIADGGTAPITLTCAGLTQGSKFKGTITVTYMKTGGTLAQTSTGNIAGSVAA